MYTKGDNPFVPESIARFKALDTRYDQEIFYEKMPEHMAKYGSKP